MARIHTLTLIFFASLIFISCCDEDEVFNAHVEWGKIEFPGAVSIYAIHGNLNDYMLVSTISKILRTTDGGKTWIEVKKVMNPIGEFHPLNDDIYAVANFQDFVSHDQGETWEEVDFDWELSQRPEALYDSKGILYQIVGHSSGELALPTTFLRSVNKGNSWETIFPNKHGISASHIDSNDRVYLGVSGALWDGEYFHEDPEFRAYLFYTK
jgi:photosystem II stability/assembly factor-like uncharacterized protein